MPACQTRARWWLLVVAALFAVKTPGCLCRWRTQPCDHCRTATANYHAMHHLTCPASCAALPARACAGGGPCGRPRHGLAGHLRHHPCPLLLLPTTSSRPVRRAAAVHAALHCAVLCGATTRTPRRSLLCCAAPVGGCTCGSLLLHRPCIIPRLTSKPCPPPPPPPPQARPTLAPCTPPSCRWPSPAAPPGSWRRWRWVRRAAAGCPDLRLLQSKWYQWGFVFSVLYLAVWVFIGGPWWKAIGIF